MDTLIRFWRYVKPMLKILNNEKGEVDPTAPPVETPPEPSQDEPSWIDVLPDDAKTDPNVTKYKTPEEFYQGYKNQVEMIGKKGIIVPGENATPEEKETFLNSLGRPSKPEEYKFNEIQDLHESIKVTPESQGAFNAVSHKIGLTNEQANGLNEWYMNEISNQLKAQDKADLEAKNTAETALRKEWGEKFDNNTNLVAKMMLKAGGQEAIDAMGGKEGLGNNPHVLKALGVIAGMLSEDTIDKIQSSSASPTGSETVEEAKAKINKLNTEKESEEYKALWDPEHSKHHEMVKERDRLYKIAYGGGQ